ncbi:hypothetical protein Y1Q_0001039 [Alligator mississippiensis]|uniref:Uncharacterized protein n=1 Tax=Alligator mississippiensis TaxID=8496 RepID=A0A151NEA9_ALLMI|nr:hypothetical protein Y1Q_0001039 [Alligator mississippiensis]
MGPRLPGRGAWWSSLSWRRRWSGSRSLRQLQSFSSTACRTPAKMPCLLESRLVATPSESLDPVPYSEVREGHRRVLFKHGMDNSLSFSRKHSALTSVWPKQSPRYLSVCSSVSVVH